ncbi:membrane protein [Spirilliplanes yamanashiensis]|uniref:Membrane protein n=2 Tax=Spirilliplanes yamanashiensis TaxID=42233 RepID=A0A8J3Y706_9ACTN|nr:membrane protein [Spirilliplanes yamanashiensis]
MSFRMTTDVPDSAAQAADPDRQPAPATPARSYIAVQDSAEFAGLRRALRRFIFPMTVAFFLWYALYVLLSAYARGFMGLKIIGNINVALVFGLLQFVSTFAIAWAYSRYADRNIDPTAEKIKADLDAGEAK